jgi:DNA-directed DNA polymerase III PolC
MSFSVHLKSRSYYSFLEGLASPTELAQAAAAAGLGALALCDYRGLSGAVEFYDACRAEGVQPLLGLEIHLLPPARLAGAAPSAGRLALFAQDLTGWGSLCRLSSALHTAPELIEAPGLPFERLAEYSAGLICLSGGRSGLAARLVKAGQEEAAILLLSRLEEIFPEACYLEVQRHSEVDRRWTIRLSALARRLRLPLVATHEIYYLDAKQEALQRVVSAMRLNRPLEGLPEEHLAPPGAYFSSVQEMEQRFADLPQALETAAEIAARCRLELPVGRAHFPQVELPAGVSADELLRRKAEAGATRLYGRLTPAIRQRLDHELGVIAQTGFATLFLVMEEIIAFARQAGVPYSSRGSAASSLAAHCLGITSPDPLRLNLFFERFLNPARSSPPDIDTDLCSRRRDEVIRFVYRRYGEERVAMVCTVNRFRRRSALREVAKAYGLPLAEIKKLADALPHRWYGPRPNEEGPPFADLAEQYPAPGYQAVFRDAAALLDHPRHLSIHPGGIVIAPDALTDFTALMLAPKGMVITQFDLDSIERLGLVKLDLLGIRGLTVLGDVGEKLPAAETSDGVSALQGLESIPETDAAVSEAVRLGRTIGCFQIESPGMRATLREIGAQNVDDIMVALALYRPGPLTGGLKDAFVRRHRGEEPPAHLHPALGPLLADTYGVILYQEQVLRIAHELAGLSLADADLLRRAMSHFDPGKQMQTLKEKFIAGALAHSGAPPAVGERVWDLMAAFAGYGFPKAHAASYAQIAWRSAWCKTHYPAPFMAAVLANWGGYYGQRVYLTEARRLGLTLRPPHVNYARRQFSVSYLDDQPALFMGLDQVRDLTQRTQQRIQRLRPFASLDDFLARADPRAAEAENLARAGALEGFGTIPELLSRLKGESRRRGQLSLFALEADAAPDWTLAEKVAAQEDILGVGVDAHPLELAAEQLERVHALTTLEAAARLGQTVRVAGMRQTWRRSQTVRGEHIYFMSLEDLEGMLDVVITAEVYRRSRQALSAPGPFVVEGNMVPDPASGEPFLRAIKIERLI